jgi:hypothetical protein
VGEVNGRNIPVFSPDGCLPDSVGALLMTDRGLWWLLKDKLGKAKGVPTRWFEHGNWSGRSVEQLTNIHIWTAVSASLHHCEKAPTSFSTPVLELDASVSTINAKKGS